MKKANVKKKVDNRHNVRTRNVQHKEKLLKYKSLLEKGEDPLEEKVSAEKLEQEKDRSKIRYAGIDEVLTPADKEDIFRIFKPLKSKTPSIGKMIDSVHTNSSENLLSALTIRNILKRLITGNKPDSVMGNIVTGVGFEDKLSQSINAQEREKEVLAEITRMIENELQ